MNLQTVAQHKNNQTAADYGQFFVNAKTENLKVLTETNRAEVLEFLNMRPVHTVVMASFIQDNGLSPQLDDIMR